MKIDTNLKVKGLLIVQISIIGAVCAIRPSYAETSGTQSPPVRADVPKPKLDQAGEAKTETKTETKTESKAEPKAEIDALKKIHQVNQLEIQAGSLAKSKGSTREVRSYGDRLVRDHKKADQMISEYAKKQGIELSAAADLSPEQKLVLERLKSKSGTEFDSDFLSMMEKDHTQAIQLVTSARDQTENEQLKSILNKIIPLLEEHHELAVNLTEKQKSKG